MTYYTVVLLGKSYYGGPEEGGWWGKDWYRIHYRGFDTEEQAYAYRDELREVYKSDDLYREWCANCAAELEMCENRGIDVDTLGEDDGPDDYWVYVSEELPEAVEYGVRHYE